MNTSIHEIQEVSPAFRQALLRSERNRIIGIVLFLSSFAGLMFIRIFVLGSAMSRFGLLLVSILIVCELGILVAINEAQKSDGAIPRPALCLGLIFCDFSRTIDHLSR